MMKTVKIDNMVIELLVDYAEKITDLHKRYRALQLDLISGVHSEEQESKAKALCKLLSDEGGILAILVLKVLEPHQTTPGNGHNVTP